MSYDGRADEGIGAAPLVVAENRVHLGDGCDGSFRCVLVHLAQRVGSRMDGEEIGADRIVSLEVVLDRDECHQVAFGWKVGEKINR